MLDAAHRPRISEAVMRRISERAERRSANPPTRDIDASELSRRFRCAPPASLRRRIYP